MSVNTCLIYRCLSSASAVIRSWFIYELQKSTTIAFSRNSLYTFYSRNPTCGILPCLRISSHKYPPCPQNFIIVNPPSPLEILKVIRGIGMDIFWNRPFWASFAGFNPYFLMQDMNWCLATSLKLITFKASCSITLAAGMGTHLCVLRKRVINQSKEIMALNVPDVLLFMIVY